VVSKYLPPGHAAFLSQWKATTNHYEHAALEPSSRVQQSGTTDAYCTLMQSAGQQAFPITAYSLSMYATYYCHFLGNSSRSMTGKLSQLYRTNRELGHPPLTAAADARLKDVLKGLGKADRTPVRRKQPMTLEVLAKICKVADLATHRDYQHITMARLAHACLLRSGELVQLRVGHLSWSADRQQVTITIHHSKVNKRGPPELVILKDSGPAGALAYLREYWRVLSLDSRHASANLWPTFSTADQVNWAQPVTRPQFIKSARVLLSKAGYRELDYAGHSYRSGGATDLWASLQCRAHTIQLYGRWRSDVYKLYLRDHPEVRAAEVASAFAAVHATIPTSSSG
jgi:integrase